MRQSLTILILFLLLCGGKLFAQGGNGCPPDAQGALSCETACQRCVFEYVEDALVAPTLQPIPIDPCFNGAPPLMLDNPRWYQFVPASPFAFFSIKSPDCPVSQLEYALVFACGTNPYTALTCGVVDPNDPVIQLTGMTPGVPYYLVIDGVNGAQCKYFLELTAGSTLVPELGDIGDISGPSEVCPKAKAYYSLPKVPNATTYTWVAPPGSKIDGGSNVRVIKVNAGSPSGPSTVQIEFGTLGGTLCVTAGNNCDTPKTVCIPIVNQAIPITELPELTVCFEELPYFWDQPPGNFIAAPGTYTLTSTPFQSYLGCDSIVRQKIIAKPRIFRNLPPTWLCRDECLQVGDYEFCESGNYQEILTAESGCDSAVNFIIIQIPVHSAVKLPIDTITCRVPSIILRKDSTATVGNTVNYRWIDSQGNTLSFADTVVVSMPGQYSLITTNYGGGRACADTATVTVPGNLTHPMADAGPNQILTCGEPIIQLHGSGSMGSQYTYLWLAFNGGNIVSGSTTLTPTINATGTYRLRVTNVVNGCTSTDNTLVTAQVLPPTVSVTGGTFSCVEPNVNLQSTTNASNATYEWTGPNGFTSNDPNPVVNAAGEYTLVVTDGDTGCANTATATVVADTNLPGASTMPGVLTCVVDTVTLGGNSPATNVGFAWTGPNGFTSDEASPAVTETGVYTLTVTGQNGCTSTATANVTRNDTPPGATLAVAGNLNCNNASINITASSTAPAGTLQHVWTKPDGSMQSTGTGKILAATAPGAYSVVITNSTNGCTSTATATVAQSPAVTAAISSTTNVLCFGQQNGSATVVPGGGNGTYTYAWNTGANTATLSGVGSGTYTVTVTDGENCKSTATATITQPVLLTANTMATPQMANGAADGTATANPAGGTPTYSYEWSTGDTTKTVTGLLPGAYTVTVTDANGCTAVSIASVSAYDCTIEASVQPTDASCFEANDGQATAVPVNGIAPFTYLWSTGDTTVSITGLAPGVYTVVVTDAANCPEAVAFTIAEPNLLRANATVVPMSGPATDDGSASASGSGGTSPYMYLWSTDSTTATIENLAAGLYTVTVTDANGCTAVQTVEVLPGNCGITSSFVTTDALCNGDANGSATVVLNGGVGPFQYLWSSGGTAETETGLAAGTYTVTVVDSNDCDISDVVTITEPPVLAVALDTATNTACPNLPEGTATVQATGGSGSVLYAWSNGQSGPSASDLVAGTYTVTATDANDCTAELEVIIEAVDTEPPVIANDSLIARLGVAGTVTLSVQSIGLDVSDNCTIDEISFVPTSYNCSQLGPHAVQVTVTDDAGNITVDTITVTVVDELPPTLTCPSSIVRCFGDDIVSYDAPVAIDNCLGNGGMFALVSGLPSGSMFPPGTTTNTYTYTDADGNVGSCTFEVTILDQLTLSYTKTNDIDNKMIGAIDITVNGSLSPYTFQWMLDGNTISTNEDLQNIGMGKYVVIVTDDIGCTIVSDTITITSMVNSTEPDWSAGLLIFPNPTSGHLSVVFPDNLNQDARLMVFDMTGRMVKQQLTESPKQVDFDLSSLPQGMYSIRINVNNQVVMRKIVISR